MKAVFLFLLVLSVSLFAQGERELAHIEVHEWGVITWDNGVVSAQGAPYQEIYWEAEAKAPIVYFSGPEFAGSFTVTVENGEIIELYPVSGEWESDRYIWNGKFTWDDSQMNYVEESGSYNPADFRWFDYLDYWRTPEKLTYYGNDGMVEKFLYYETRIDDVSFLPLYPGIQFEYENDRFYNMEVLILGIENGNLMATTCILGRFATISVLPLGWETEVSENGSEIRDIFYEWSRDIVNIQEIDALWNTWNHWFTDEAFRGENRDEGSALVIYLMPQDLIDNVSTLFLETENGYPVDYCRYLLVAVPVTL